MAFFRIGTLPLALAFGLLILPAAAQQVRAPSTDDTVTVTGAREAAIAKFIETRAAATRVAGKIGRWQTRICPLTYGIPAAYGKFVAGKVKEVATLAGVPVDAEENCRVNIQIVFTTSPQALMDNIRREHPAYLGYHDNLLQAEQMTTLKRPVHAFYTTQTRDYRGHVQADVGRCGLGGNDSTPGATPADGALNPEASPSIPGNISSTRYMTLPCARVVAASGMRFIEDGLEGEFRHIVIVVDTTKVTHMEMGSLGDYIAMLALSQPVRFDACQDLPSVTNLMIDPACAASTIVTAISAHDLAYLSGLYKMSAGRSLNMQKSEINYQMRQVQDGDGPVTATVAAMVNNQPSGAGNPADVVCRPPLPLKGVRRLGPQICKTNALWAQYREEGILVAPDGSLGRLADPVSRR